MKIHSHRMDVAKISWLRRLAHIQVWNFLNALIFDRRLGSCAAPKPRPHFSAWWRHQMETFSTLLTICAENSPVTGEFPAQRPVTRSFDVFFDLRLNKRLSKRWWGWWFETPSRQLWRHCNGDKEMRTFYVAPLSLSKSTHRTRGTYRCKLFPNCG